MVQAQGPLAVFKQFHDKFCLFVGQGKIHAIAKEYPFDKFIYIIYKMGYIYWHFAFDIIIYS